MLYPGQTIAQLFFHLVTDQNMVPSKAKSPGSQYVGTVDMIPRQISSKTTSKALKKLVRRFDKLSRI